MSIGTLSLALLSAAISALLAAERLLWPARHAAALARWVAPADPAPPAPGRPAPHGPIFRRDELGELLDEDPELAVRLVDLFLHDVGAAAAALEQALASGALREAAELAHRIKGASAQLGLEALRRHCAHIEQRARSGELAGGRRAATALRRTYDASAAALAAFRRTIG